MFLLGFLCDVKSYFSCCQGWSGEFSMEMDGGNLISLAVGKRVISLCDDLEDCSGESLLIDDVEWL